MPMSDDTKSGLHIEFVAGAASIDGKPVELADVFTYTAENKRRADVPTIDTTATREALHEALSAIRFAQAANIDHIAMSLDIAADAVMTALGELEQ